MFILLSEVKRQIPTITTVSSSAIASDYQRLRVECVCSRLGLNGTAYNKQVQNSINGQKRKEVDTSNFQPSINLPKKQANKTLYNQVNNC